MSIWEVTLGLIQDMLEGIYLWPRNASGFPGKDGEHDWGAGSMGFHVEATAPVTQIGGK